jgi:hypothetical protein
MEVALVVVALIALVGFRQYLTHHRRMMVHRERMLAIERGVELPPLEQEIKRSNWNVQRVLLLAGLVWIALGIGAIVLLSAILGHQTTPEIPQGLQWIGIAPIGIGLSHVIVYLVGRNRA